MHDTNTISKDQTASWKRLLLAGYLDFILAIVLLELVQYAFGNSITHFETLSAFGLLEALLYKVFGLTPGMHILGIDHNRHVDPDLKSRENFLTMFLGVLFIMGATKRLVRWTEMDAPWPFMGIVPGFDLNLAICLCIGTLGLIAGYWYLRMDRRGFWLAGMLVLFEFISSILSRPLWSHVIETQVLERRKVQGLPVRSGEIEFMQSFFPAALTVCCIMIFIGILLTRKKFQDVNTSSKKV